MTKLIVSAAITAAVLAGAAPAAADSSTGRSGRGVENKTAPPAPRAGVPADFSQKLATAVRHAILGE